jgi:hypothetical protein
VAFAVSAKGTFFKEIYLDPPKMGTFLKKYAMTPPEKGPFL